jgi:hypothetical protein
MKPCQFQNLLNEDENTRLIVIGKVVKGRSGGEFVGTYCSTKRFEVLRLS